MVGRSTRSRAHFPRYKWTDSMIRAAMSSCSRSGALNWRCSQLSLRTKHINCIGLHVRGASPVTASRAPPSCSCKSSARACLAGVLRALNSSRRQPGPLQGLEAAQRAELSAHIQG